MNTTFNTSLNQKTQTFGAWSGVFFLLVMLIGWWLIAGFLPVHSPTLTADQVAEVYRTNHTRILFGMIFIMFGSMMSIPFTGSIAHVLWRIEGGVGMLTSAQIMAGIANCLLTFFPPLLWVLAAYRIDRNPEIILMINDMAWIMFIGGLTPIIPMLLTVGFGAFNDKSAHPVFPRWMGFLSVWTLVLMLPGQLIFFFKAGPFAWNGILGFWLPVTIYGTWFAVVSRLMWLAVKREGKNMNSYQ